MHEAYNIMPYWFKLLFTQLSQLSILPKSYLYNCTKYSGTSDKGLSESLLRTQCIRSLAPNYTFNVILISEMHGENLSLKQTVLVPTCPLFRGFTVVRLSLMFHGSPIFSNFSCNVEKLSWVQGHKEVEYDHDHVSSRIRICNNLLQAT